MLGADRLVFEREFGSGQSTNIVKHEFQTAGHAHPQELTIQEEV